MTDTEQLTEIERKIDRIDQRVNSLHLPPQRLRGGV